MTPINKWTWRGFSRWAKSGWRAIWPYADKALELAKPMLIKIYDKAVDKHQAKLVEVYNTKGLPAASALYDKAQSEVRAIISKASLVPQNLRDSACNIIEDEGNKFQVKALNIARKDGSNGLNKLIDQIQAEIRERILAL